MESNILNGKGNHQLTEIIAHPVGMKARIHAKMSVTERSVTAIATANPANNNNNVTL